MFAIVNISGKQFRVTKGDQVKVPSLNTEAGKKMVDLYNAVFPPYVNESDSNFGLSLEEVVSFLKARE